MNGPAILACGEVLWDLFPDGPRLGGAPANFASHAAILGGQVSFLSGVGNDLRGVKALEILRSLGVDTTLTQVIDGSTTGVVDVAFDADNRPSYRIHPDSAWDYIAWTSALASRVAASDAIYFGTMGQRAELTRSTTRHALDLAKARGIPRVLDINLRAPFFGPAMLRESIAFASVVKLSDEELAEVAAACDVSTANGPEAALRELLVRYGLALIVMTRGAAGAMVVTPAGTLEQAGIPTKVVDTVGAGDSFSAALTIGLLLGLPLDVNVRKACEIAAAVCSHAGAVDSVARKVD
jgi:fructokinase